MTRAEAKAAQKARNASPKGKAACKVYNTSSKGKLRKKAYNETLRGKVNRLLRDAKLRAKKRNLPFTITNEDVKRLILTAERKWKAINEYLPDVWKLKFDYSSKDGRANPFAPSLDQIRPGEGYTPNNVQIVHLFWNVLMSDWLTDAQGITICDAISAAHLAVCENPELAEICRAS